MSYKPTKMNGPAMIKKRMWHFVVVISAFALFAADSNVQLVSAQPTPRM